MRTRSSSRRGSSRPVLGKLDAVAEFGGQIGPSLVIYHGEVNEDSDGPVEVCLPIPPRITSATSLPTRVEPAHREAFTTVTRAQVRYPDIVSAYDATLMPRQRVLDVLTSDAPATDDYGPTGRFWTWTVPSGSLGPERLR